MNVKHIPRSSNNGPHLYCCCEGIGNYWEDVRFKSLCAPFVHFKERPKKTRRYVSWLSKFCCLGSTLDFIRIQYLGEIHSKVNLWNTKPKEFWPHRQLKSFKISSYMAGKTNIWGPPSSSRNDFESHHPCLQHQHQVTIFFFNVKHTFHKDWTIYIKAGFSFCCCCLFVFWRDFSVHVFVRGPESTENKEEAEPNIEGDWEIFPAGTSQLLAIIPVSFPGGTLGSSLLDDLQHIPTTQDTSQGNSHIPLTIQPDTSATDMIVSDKLISCSIWYENESWISTISHIWEHVHE